MMQKHTTAAVMVKDLAKKYRHSDEFALKGINFSISKGHIFGLLGPNGSGKTTTISIMCGLVKPTQGEAFIYGRHVRRDLRHVKKLIGLVPQDLALYPTLTLRENLRYFGSMHGLRGKSLQEKIAESLQISQLDRFADRKIETFSGGMKRRANLVAGIIHHPSVLFLDEPTLGVDPQSRNVIFKSLNEMKNAGVTMVYTTHYMEEAQQLCTRLGIMDAGNIVAEGTPKELINSMAGCRDLGELFLALTGKHLRD
jgi:ABC-2 type transport system ATP-binding protein